MTAAARSVRPDTPATPAALPAWADPRPWLDTGPAPATEPDVAAFARLLRSAGPPALERMACEARALTQRHFGRTVSLYVPLYLSNHCTGGCAYCGFAADVAQPRARLAARELTTELRALRAMGFDEVLLLTGERGPRADFAYLRRAVAAAARLFSRVTVEAFAMRTEEYRALAEAGCTGVTLYQETYDPALYARVHRWGEKRDFAFRLEAPARALAAGMRTVGLGALLGLGDPLFDAVALYRHAVHLRRCCWQGGLSVSFPRLRPHAGGGAPAHPVGDRLLAQLVFAFRLALPDVPLVLSTRESAAFRDGMAGVGISKMSAASRTTVGGYAAGRAPTGGQFETDDTRSLDALCAALRARGLDPVCKDWDGLFHGPTG